MLQVEINILLSTYGKAYFVGIMVYNGDSHFQAPHYAAKIPSTFNEDRASIPGFLTLLPGDPGEFWILFQSTS